MSKSKNELNDIAGGDYWQAIIAAYKKNEIDGYKAEELFAESEKMAKKRYQSYIRQTKMDWSEE